MMDLLFKSLVIGAAGTAAMDLWALLLHRVAGRALPDWGLVGRWFAWLPRGRVFHGDITRTPAIAQETAIGWAAHYAVGIAYAAALLLLVPAFGQSPTFLPAFATGMITIAAGWFLLSPGMGGGWAASKSPKPTMARLATIAAHTAFALGLWAGGLIVAG